MTALRSSLIRQLPLTWREEGGAQVVADERAGRARRWHRGDDVSTEDLRQALRCYRFFFERLPSV